MEGMDFAKLNRQNVIRRQLRQGDEWRSARYQCITGTDVGKILGADEITSRQKLFDCKVREIDPLENASPYLRYLLDMGRAWERVAIDSFIIFAKYKFGDCNGWVPGMTPHETIKWLVGTPDFVFDYRDTKVVMENKCHFYPTPRLAVPYKSASEVPIKHWLQVQCYIEIMNLPKAILWSWTICNGASAFEINRDAQFWKKEIEPILSHFYDLLWGIRLEYSPEKYDKSMADLRFKRGEKAELIEKLQQRLILTTDMIMMCPSFPIIQQEVK